MERYDHEAASVLEDLRSHYDIFIESMPPAEPNSFGRTAQG